MCVQHQQRKNSSTLKNLDDRKQLVFFKTQSQTQSTHSITSHFPYHIKYSDSYWESAYSAPGHKKINCLLKWNLPWMTPSRNGSYQTGELEKNILYAISYVYKRTTTLINYLIKVFKYLSSLLTLMLSMRVFVWTNYVWSLLMLVLHFMKSTVASTSSRKEL